MPAAVTFHNRGDSPGRAATNTASHLELEDRRTFTPVCAMLCQSFLPVAADVVVPAHCSGTSLHTERIIHAEGFLTRLKS